MDYLKVDGHTHLKRDPQTNSIINDNMSEYNDYIKRKKLKSNEDQKIQKLEDDIATIKDDMNELKTLLRRIANESR